jgi:PEP-CTERM motif
MSFKSLSIVAAAVLALTAGAAQAQNRFANGGFEDAQATILGNPIVVAPDPTKAQGWIPGGVHGYNRSTDARTGSFSALVAQLTPDSNAVAFQNSKATAGMPNLVAGDSLTLSFWAKAQVTEDLSFYNFSYALRFLNDNGNILAQGPIINFAQQTNNSTWSLITSAPLVVPVGATAAFVEFSAAAGGRLAAYRVDDVSLVPEPGTYALMLAGLACVGGIAARRRRAA